MMNYQEELEEIEKAKFNNYCKAIGKERDCMRCPLCQPNTSCTFNYMLIQIKTLQAINKSLNAKLQKNNN